MEKEKLIDSGRLKHGFLNRDISGFIAEYSAEKVKQAIKDTELDPKMLLRIYDEDTQLSSKDFYNILELYIDCNDLEKNQYPKEVKNIIKTYFRMIHESDPKTKDYSNNILEFMNVIAEGDINNNEVIKKCKNITELYNHSEDSFNNHTGTNYKNPEKAIKELKNISDTAEKHALTGSEIARKVVMENKPEKSMAKAA